MSGDMKTVQTVIQRERSDQCDIIASNLSTLPSGRGAIEDFTPIVIQF